MEDLIRRGDALLECERLTPIECRAMKERIKSIPAVEPKQEWIPCSERLPNEDGTYLVTDEWVGKTGTKYIEIEGIDFEHGRWNCLDYEKVTAWMPLPKPWKGASK